VDFSPYVLFMSNQIQFYVSHASSISNTYWENRWRHCVLHQRFHKGEIL
jgi:hypothetical protein